MLSFFKRKGKNPKKQGLDSTVESKDIVAIEESATTEEEVQTTLSIHPDWNVSEEDRYIYQFMHNSCDPLKPNQLSLSGLDLHREEGTERVIVTALVRNSLSQTVRLQATPLVLIGSNNEILAKKTFDLEAIGEIPERSSRPWHFAFEKETLLTDTLPENEWKLAFQLKPSHKLDLEESWQKSLAPEQQASLKELVETKLPALNEGEVNFMGLQANRPEDKSLHVTILIRNGSEKDLTLQQLPLFVEDATGEVVATGGFKLDNLTVKAYTTKPWTFIFPAELVQKEDIDLSKWRAYAKQ
ncbi:accessory Sec system S-layer assembly protein [Metabacillus iocasae]|uniref:Accessory Sec system S-layer assembly protein n=1 Tax=Priestia iocasae TaxID=2291674 RepID=A0ABS2QXL4_9BACI|nr:accessory Sec system S-layer assembly protein [Metabacillus iocasae]MBM7704003.1 accessory Sec system S-layer assembly protein [Metabacillus iocasae]